MILASCYKRHLNLSDAFIIFYGSIELSIHNSWTLHFFHADWWISISSIIILFFAFATAFIEFLFQAAIFMRKQIYFVKRLLETCPMLLHALFIHIFLVRWLFHSLLNIVESFAKHNHKICILVLAKLSYFYEKTTLTIFNLLKSQRE
jgi:hypothetical protein